MERRKLLDLLQKCGHYLHHQKGKKFGQYRILLILKNHPDMQQKELLECLHIQPGSLSEILSKMESNGLILRKRVALDKRRIQLCLTEAGMKKIDQLMLEYEKENEQLFLSLSDLECEALFQMLSKLYLEWKGETYV